MEVEKGDLAARVPSVILPEGYRGKILLVSITWGGQSMVALRSGDLWHHEILRNTREEMLRLGLDDARVEELGGAHLRFAADGSIRIWGGSDAFGACDRDVAAGLVRQQRPDCPVVVDGSIAAGEMA
jgi:hypothetical protein